MAIGADKFLLLLADKGEAGGSPYLDGVEGLNVEFEYDFSDANSYAGTGTTLNSLIAVPYTNTDTQAGNVATIQGTSPQFVEADASNPAYLSPSASADEHFKIASLTDFVANIPVTTGGKSFWVATIHWRAVGNEEALVLFDSRFTSSTAKGIVKYSQPPTNNRNLTQYFKNSINNVAGVTGSTADTGVWYLSITTYTHDGVSTGEGKQYVNSSAVNSTAAANDVGDTAGNGPLMFMRREESLSFNFQQNDRMAWAAGGSKYLTDADVAAIIENLKSRTVGNWITFS